MLLGVAFPLGVIVLAAACQATSDSSALENPWYAEEDGASSAVCQGFCASATCEPLDKCAARCDWLLDLGAQIGAELDTECGAAVESTLACATVVGCLASQTQEPTCSVESLRETMACGGQPVYYLGWESCHRYCDAAIACSEAPFTGWHDCFGECKGNALLDQSAGCLGEGIALRECYAAGSICEKFNEEAEHQSLCQPEEQEWDSCVSSSG